MENRLSENVQNFRQSQKFHLESHRKLNDEVDSGRINPSKGKNPKKHLHGRLTFTIAFRYSNDVTKLYILTK